MGKTVDDLKWAVDGPPIGVWVTSGGTFNNVMEDRLCLRPDGTGYLRSRSVLDGEELFPILWQQEEPGTLKIDRLFSHEEQDRPPVWQTVHYIVAMKANDIGRDVPTLKNADNDVFWSLVGPIELKSRTPD